MTVPHFFKLLSFIPTKKGSVTFTTNGTLIKKYLNELKKEREKIRGIMVSIAGASEKTHRYLRNTSLQPILSGIQELVVNKFPVGIAFDVYKYNLCELEKAVQMALKLGVQSIIFNPVENIGGRSSSMEEELFNFNIKNFISILDRLEKDYGNQILIGNSLLLKDNPICKKALKKIGYRCSIYDPKMLFITPSGEVHSCFTVSLITKDFLLGKLPYDEIKVLLENKKRIFHVQKN